MHAVTAKSKLDRQGRTLLHKAWAAAGQSPQLTRTLADRAAGLAAEAGDRVLEAEAILCGGYQLTRCTDPQSTWEALQRAERIFRANGRPESAARCQVASARALYDMGREHQALAHAHAALQEPTLPAWDRACCYAVMFQASGRMGRLAEAFGHLEDQALPLARALGEPRLLAHLLGLKAWFFARVIHSAQNPDLPLPNLIEHPHFDRQQLNWASVRALFDEAQAALPSDCVDWDLSIDRQYALGLAREPGAAVEAARALDRLAHDAEVHDPTAAAWGHFCRAMVLHDAGNVAGALEALPHAMRLAERCGLTTMTRDLCYFQSLCHETAGEIQAAFAALKRYLDMTLRSMAPDERGAALRPAPLPTERLAVDPGLRPAEPASVRRALRVIEQRVGDALTPAQVAEACQLSRRALDAAFGAAKGVTVSAFLRRKQFEFAAEQLLHTDRPVREIALAIGYRSPTMFSREFRQRMGLTPSQWRDMVGRDASAPGLP